MSENPFTEAIRAAVARSSVRELADEIGVSHPTIRRWMDGRNLPVPGMRAAVLRFVEGRPEERIG